MSPKKKCAIKRSTGKKAVRQRMKNLKLKKTNLNTEAHILSVETPENNTEIDLNTMAHVISVETLENNTEIDLNTMAHVLSVETPEINTEMQNNLTGRRVVDIAYLFEQAQTRHTGGTDCSFIDMYFKHEVIVGFHSTFVFKCKVCGIEQHMYSEKHKEECMPINKAVVNACHAIGIGHTQLTEFTAFLDVPSLSCNGFIKIQVEVEKAIYDASWDEMKQAGEEGKRIALECGNIDSNGTPMCTVIADGQWSKRSYKTKYDALSGVAAIIGLKTQQVIFIGVRNKYCVICKRSAANNGTVPQHECFLNWTKASTSMEADGVVEGFANSITMHGLKYNRLIGDGDSSVIKRLNELLPYGPNFLIKKIECRNHLMRNYASKLTLIARNTKYPLRVRKIILSNIMRFRSDVSKAAKHWRDEHFLTMAQKVHGF